MKLATKFAVVPEPSAELRQALAAAIERRKSVERQIAASEREEDEARRKISDLDCQLEAARKQIETAPALRQRKAKAEAADLEAQIADLRAHAGELLVRRGKSGGFGWGERRDLPPIPEGGSLTDHLNDAAGTVRQARAALLHASPETAAVLAKYKSSCATAHEHMFALASIAGAGGLMTADENWRNWIFPQKLAERDEVWEAALKALLADANTPLPEA